MDLQHDDSPEIEAGAGRMAFGPGAEGTARLRAQTVGDEPIEVAVAYTEADFLRGLAEHQRRSPQRRRMFVVTVVDLALLGWAAMLGANLSFIFAILLVLAFTLSLPRLVRRTAVRIMRRDAAWRSTHQWTISDDGVLVVRPNADSRLGWGGVQRVIETADSFMFYPQTLQFMLLPKRFLTPEQVERVRALAEAHTNVER